jgi:tetratricopeptide (TPR) repeat protein
MKRQGTSKAKASYTEADFCADAEYAESIFRDAIGDHKACISALERALAVKPTYAPAILSMGSVEYQRGRRAKGRRLFHSLLSLPKDTTDLCQIIDEAGSFLIHFRQYKDGLELFRAAIKLFPAVAALHQGLGCCAGHEGHHDEAVAASERALELEPGNQKFVNDLGWSLFEAGRLEEAARMLGRAVAMDPSDELARENLRICTADSARRRKKRSSNRGHAGTLQDLPLFSGAVLKQTDINRE